MPFDHSANITGISTAGVVPPYVRAEAQQLQRNAIQFYGWGKNSPPGVDEDNVVLHHQESDLAGNRSLHQEKHRQHSECECAMRKSESDESVICEV